MHPAPEWIGASPPSGGLRLYLDLLRARWLFIAMVVALAAATAAVVVTNTAKVYAAEADVLVTPLPASNADLFGLGLVPESGDPTRDAETVAQLITTETVARRVRARLGLHQSTRSLLKDVSAAPVAQSSIVTITARAKNSDLAARLANAFGEATIALRTDRLHALLDTVIPRLQQQLNALPPNETRTSDLGTKLQDLQALRLLPDPTLHVETAATAASSPVSPRPVLTVAAAFIGALVLGIGGVLAAHLLDPRIGREDDLRRYRIPILGRIPLEPRRRRLGGHAPLRPDELSRSTGEAFHRLASSLAGRTNNDKSAIFVTGAAPGEGKTTTALNLAASLAAASDRVLLIEGDARRPSLARAFGLGPGPDLGDVVTSQRPLNDAVNESDRLPAGLSVITADEAGPEAAAPVSPEVAEYIIHEAKKLSSWLVVDSPSLNYVADLLQLAKRVESVLLVVRLRATRARDLADLAELLAQQGITPDGFVVIGGKGRPTYHTRSDTAGRNLRSPGQARDRVRGTWSLVRGREPLDQSPYFDPADEVGVPGLRDEEAQVQSGRPRTPPQSGAVALPLAEPNEPHVDADGRPAGNTK
jgi:Mrp family chromosome partitioning ATPase/capsular polysaccharide biosynthesis protein